MHANNRMIESSDENCCYAWYIQRNLVMQMMLNSEATEDDLLWLIDSVDILTQLSSIKGRIRIMAEEQGIWTEQTSQAFKSMQDTLERTNSTAVESLYKKTLELSAAS